jgi:hypothetical protein
LVELPSQRDHVALTGGDAVDAHPRWVSLSLPSAQKPECRRLKSCPPDQAPFKIFTQYLP